jgi:hypothetical protein
VRFTQTLEFMMQTTLHTKLAGFALALVVTTGILGGLDALATTGQSSDALLAQQGALVVSCAAPGTGA